MLTYRCHAGIQCKKTFTQFLVNFMAYPVNQQVYHHLIGLFAEKDMMGSAIYSLYILFLIPHILIGYGMGNIVQAPIAGYGLD